MVRPSFDQVDYGEQPEPVDGSDILRRLIAASNEIYRSSRRGNCREINDQTLAIIHSQHAEDVLAELLAGPATPFVEVNDD